MFRTRDLLVRQRTRLINAIKRGAPKGSRLEDMLARKPRMLVTVALAYKMAGIRLGATWEAGEL